MTSGCSRALHGTSTLCSEPSIKPSRRGSVCVPVCVVCVVCVLCVLCCVCVVCCVFCVLCVLCVVCYLSIV